MKMEKIELKKYMYTFSVAACCCKGNSKHSFVQLWGGKMRIQICCHNKSTETHKTCCEASDCSNFVNSSNSSQRIEQVEEFSPKTHIQDLSKYFCCAKMFFRTSIMALKEKYFKVLPLLVCLLLLSISPNKSFVCRKKFIILFRACSLRIIYILCAKLFWSLFPIAHIHTYIYIYKLPGKAITCAASRHTRRAVKYK